MIRVDDITLYRGSHAILKNVSLDVKEGELLGIVGPNGAGKTTLLRILAGILQPDAGRMSLHGKPSSDWSPHLRAREIAYLPQNPECHWAMTVERVVALGRLPHLSPWHRPTDADMTAINNAMRDMGVLPFATRGVGTLSGGEFARVMLARALAATPQLLLADEPVADLDPYHSLDVMEHLQRLTRAGRAVVVVLHDLALASRFCTRVALMGNGSIVAEGSPATALSSDNLARIYRIAALHGERDGEPFLLPWSRLDGPGEGP